MARLSRARRADLGRALRSYHRTVRAIVKANPGTSYRRAQASYRTIRETRDVKPTAHYVRAHPRIVQSAVRGARERVTTRTERAMERTERAIERLHGLDAEATATYAGAPTSPADQIKDLDSLDALIDYFEEHDFEDYDDVEIEANADYEEKAG